MDWSWRLLKDYKQEDFLLLSGIQHYAFCKRQWALIHIEKQWAENVKTMEGKILHENAHDETVKEKRGNLVISRAMPIQSYQLGVSGECDVVEFRKDINGIDIPKLKGKYSVTPIEYKRGKPKEGNEDVFQLVAQAMCLEEMFCCNIEVGYLFYYETRRRVQVVITRELKEHVTKCIEEMHQLFDRQYTPLENFGKSCNSCSLKAICLPVLGKKKSVRRYINNVIQGDE